MWYYSDLQLPYGADEDYRNSILAALRGVLGVGVQVDFTMLLLEGYGHKRVEFDTDEAGARAVGQLPQFTMVRPVCDRGMMVGERTIAVT